MYKWREVENNVIWISRTLYFHPIPQSPSWLVLWKDSEVVAEAAFFILIKVARQYISTFSR